MNSKEMWYSLLLLLSGFSVSFTFGSDLRVACIGDSITFGSGVEEREKNAYPQVLQQALGAGYEVRNFGVSGATLLKNGDKPYWKLDEMKRAAEFLPDVVVIKLGTNDSKPQNWKHEGEFAADLRAMIDHFSALQSKPKIWLCKPVPVYEDKWGINDETVRGEIVPIIEEVAEEKNVPTIDLYQALSKQPEKFPDGVHPNAAGAAVIARAVAEAVGRK